MIGLRIGEDKGKKSYLAVFVIITNDSGSNLQQTEL